MINFFLVLIMCCWPWDQSLTGPVRLFPCDNWKGNIMHSENSSVESVFHIYSSSCTTTVLSKLLAACLTTVKKTLY